MSRNCLIPASARYRTALVRNPRFSRAAVRVFSALARNWSAVSRSAAKWFLPPSY
jgi:hypothetical protein